jgi:hypothetical protein
MEEVYILSDGSQVDISNFSDFEKISFLSKNPGAKKQKGVAKSAVVTSKKPQAQNGESTRANGSSDSQKYRLPNDNDFGAMQDRGILPPPSATPRSTTNVKDVYGSSIDAQEKNYRDYDALKNMLNPTFDKNFKSRLENIEPKKKTKSINDSYDEIYSLKKNSIERVDAERDVANIKEKMQQTDSDLTHPYLYYSSKNQQSLNPVEEEQIEDNFVERNYKAKELEAFGVNPQDFDGYLNKKGYKEDFKKKEAEGLFTGEGRSFGGYDIGLARELARKKMLLMYMDEMKSRDVNRQQLNQELEIVQGVRDKKEIVNNDIFDPNGMAKYVENYFPIITKKLKDKDKENAKLYEESKKGGTDFFSWDTAEKIGRASWNAVIDRTAQMSASGYQALGMESTAEGIRMLDEENKFVRRDDRGIAYVSGKAVNYNGDKYIVDTKGQIYDAGAKIRVTDLFDQSLQKKLIEEAKYGPSDWTFSTQGAAVQTSGVMADMLLQAAITHGVGELGIAAGEIRYASNVAKPASGFTSLLNDSSKLLRKVPLDRATGYSMIAQGTMGYAQGYEDTLKAARDSGINDKDAFELASAAGQRMAVLYGTTGVINPQTKLVENIFGSKNIIKKAIEQYTKTGKTGFINYIDDIVKNIPKNAIEFAEEGGKEVVQENMQQAGEIGVNMMTNKDAGKKIMNEVMTGDDFMNTSILSFISSGLISKAKLPSFHTGDQDTDNLASLSTLAKNKKEFTKIIDGLVTQKVFTTDQAESLKKDVNIYANNINKVPKNISAKGAMPVLVELDKKSKLLDEKESVDKAFHASIDLKIQEIDKNIDRIYFKDQIELSNKGIEAAIKKGVVKDIEMKNFSNSVDLKTYLVEELNVPAEVADDWSKEGGFALTSDTLKKYSKDPDSIPEGFQIILQNEDVAFRLGDSGIQQHEFLHGLLQKTIKNSPQAQMLLGGALGVELMKLDKALREKGSDERATSDEFIKRLNTYADRSKEQKLQSLIEFEAGDKTKEAHDADIAKSEGNRWEEVMTLYSDALRLGYITYNENTFTKLGDTIRRVLQYLGIRDIKFDSGKDVYNFIKDYNESAKSGKWGKAFTKMGTKGAKINTEALSKEIGGNVARSQTAASGPKFSLAPDRKSSEDIKKDVNKGYDKEKWSAGTNDRGENPAIDRVLYDTLNEYEYIIKGKAKGLGYSNLPDYSEIDMISETQLELMPHIRNFNKEFFQKREEYKKELLNSGLKPESKEFKDKVESQDLKGYQGKKGIVKENNDLNAWINSQLVNKMGNALRSGNVTTQKFTEDIDNEMFKETKIIDGYGGEDAYLMDEGNNIFDAEQDYAEEQGKLAVLLADPVYSFVDEKGKPIDIETVPFGSFFVTEATDPSVAANRKLKTETDPAKIAELNKQIKDLARGLELQAKTDITFEEKEELKSLKSFKSYDLSTGMMVNTFKALSVQDTPAKIITDEVGREILRSPNIETLEYRNFKEKLSTLSKTMARRMTFKNGPEIESLMYREWQLLYDVINHPVDPVTGESSYASKKLPPTLKEFDDQGNLRKIKDITRIKFLQAFYEIEDITRIVKIYGGENADKQLKKLEPREINPQTGKKLSQNAHFDRRTALMEMFGDVMVLQEARRLIRQPEFLSRIAEKNVNLYNDLKDDIIRAKVLNNMAKGKSDIVKFSLAPKKIVRKKPDFITTNPLNMVGDNPMYSLKYDELFSSPSDFIKFSLADIEEKAPDTIPKFKKFLDEARYEDKEGWVIKAIQLSDVQDDGVNLKKLHTFKPGNDLQQEVVGRFRNLYNSLRVDSDENEFIIKEYKEGYIDTMLERSLNLPEEYFHIPYWTKMKNDEGFRKQELKKIQNQQVAALNQIANTLDDFDLEGDTNSFFQYLFLKDILSNRYYPDGTDKIIKKSIKKSEYKTTIQPVQNYVDYGMLNDIWINYSDNKNVGIGAIYLSKQMSMETVNFDDNFIQEVDENNDLYKFNRGQDQQEINRLNKLASYSARAGYKYCTWCTGASITIAERQLGDGDFYIMANKGSKIPTLAVRYEGEEIVEIAGVRNNQNLWTQDFKLVEFAINNLPSENKELALNQLKTAKKLSNITNKDIKQIQSESGLEELRLSKNINIHFEPEIYNKSSLARNTLNTLIFNRKIQSGESPLELYKKGFNIDDKGMSNIINENEFDILNNIIEFTENVSIKVGNSPEDDLDFMENVTFVSEHLKLNELTKAKILDIKIDQFSSLEAKKLTEAEVLLVLIGRYHEQAYLSLPDKINYDIFLTFYNAYSDETPNIKIFDKEIDMSNNTLGLDFNDQTTGHIDLSNTINVLFLSVTNVVTDLISLPEKLNILETENIYPADTTKVSFTGLIEVERLNMELQGFDDILFPKLKRIGTLDITLRDEYDSDYEDIIRNSKIFKKAENVVFTYEDHEGGDFKIKTLKSKPTTDIIKFSLAEENNGKSSNFLEGLPFSQQWIVARDIDKAVLKGKTAKGNNTVFKVPSMSKSTDKAIAYTIISKVAAGYNDFEFKVKKNANGPLTRQVLNVLDFKSKEVQERMRLNNNLEQSMNEIIEQNKGIKAEDKFSPETAKNIGKNIDNNKIFLPPEDEDFLGLLYTLGSGKGTQGKKQIKFLTDNLLKPYSNAMLNLMKARQTMYKDWNYLINKKYKGISKELKKDSGYGNYLVDQAVRVYLWKKAGYEIPGLDNKDLFHLLQIVRTNPKLRDFAEDVSLLSKQANGYVEPGHNWGFGSVVGDINNIISKSNRIKFLEQWQGNADKIFSKDNMSKIEAVYGRKYVKALNNMLHRMKTGSNRAEGSSDSLLNWINGSTAVTMFFNIRSALLQTLGGINYINTSDNNVIKAGTALLNVPQYMKDFNTIWNSDYAKDRRSGLMNDVAEAELAQLMNDPRNNSLMDKFKVANYWLLKNGFGPTRVMDSFAISFGGAGFYRNRLKTYLKEGMNQEEAEKATMRDFYETSEISQQSADVSKISMNQASTKGRLLLSFMNTPFQYSRIIKKSAIDLIKGRGSAANNIAKIVYYSTIQNMMFNFLQNAMFSMFWDDDDEQLESKFSTAQFRTINGALDTLIRGTGLKGVLLASVKNAIVKWYEKSGDPKGYGDVILELANVSPSIGIKLRAMTKSYKAVEYNKDEIMYKGFSLDNTYAIEALTSLTSATLNFPADRLYTKVTNVRDALNSEYETWQRLAFILGYNKYNLGLGETKEEDTGEELKVPGLSETELKTPELK